MYNPIEIGCFAEIVGTNTPADGTLVQILFEEAPDEASNHIWVISEEFEGPTGALTDRCYEYFLKRIDGNTCELCTDWSDIAFTTGGWVPDKLNEIVEV
jgi:hypothetical protein